MNVRRVVPNLRTEDPEACGAFYARIGLSPAMELGWITTLTGTGGGASPVQLSLMTEDLTGPVVPDLSIEVDDVDAAYEELRAASTPSCSSRSATRSGVSAASSSATRTAASSTSSATADGSAASRALLAPLAHPCAPPGLLRRDEIPRLGRWRWR